MRRTIIYFLFSLLLFSCNPKSGNVQPDNQMSVSEELKRDSVRTDSLALIAYKDVLFGMTLPELKNTYVFKDAEPNSEGVLRGTYESGTIQHKNFIVYGYLTNGVLTKVTLETPLLSANYFKSELVNGANVIKEDIEKRYGKLKVYNSDPKLYQIDSGDSVLMYAGNIGDKVFMISIYEKSSGSEYKMACEITHLKYR